MNDTNLQVIRELLRMEADHAHESAVRNTAEKVAADDKEARMFHLGLAMAYELSETVLQQLVARIDRMLTDERRESA